MIKKAKVVALTMKEHKEIHQEVHGLSGVNALCKTCTEKCKQWEQVKVCRCKFYRSKTVKKTV